MTEGRGRGAAPGPEVVPAGDAVARTPPTGRPSGILALHGFTGSPESFRVVRRYLAQAGLSETPWSAPWLVGHGPTAASGEDTFDGEVARGIDAWTNGERPLLLGYSMGARLGLGLLCAAPERFAAAVLIGVSPGLACAEERRARTELEANWCRLLETQGLGAFYERFSELPVFAGQRELPPERLREQGRIRRAQTAVGLGRALRTLGLGVMPDLTPQLERLQLPVALLTGARDEKFSRLAEEMLPHLPRGVHHRVSGAGHNLLLEAPGAVAEFVSEIFDGDN